MQFLGPVQLAPQRAVQTGPSTSPISFQKAIVKNILYKEADRIAEVGSRIGQQKMTDLAAKFTFPGSIRVRYPFPEGTRGPRSHVEWAEFDLTIDKAVVDFMITDEATIRGQNQLQARMSMRRAAEAIAYQKEYNILETLYGGVSSSTPDMTVAAATYWDAWTSADRDIATDITQGIAAILKNSNISTAEIRGMTLIVPARVYPAFLQHIQVENVVTNLERHLANAFGLKILPSHNVHIDMKSSETENGSLGSITGADANCYALLIVDGASTAIHGVLGNVGIPLVERERIQGVGYNYSVTQYFGTGIVPESLDAVNPDISNSYRIYKIEGVAT